MKKPVKLNKDIVSLLEQRLEDEMSAFYFYRNASNYCSNVGFFIAAEFFRKESDSELVHAKGIENYLVSWNVQPKLPQIDGITDGFSDLTAIIDGAYTIEYALYEKYEETSMKIFKLGDLCVFDFLQEYRKIQKDSVAEYSDMINTLDGVDIESKYELLSLEEKLFKLD